MAHKRSGRSWITTAVVGLVVMAVAAPARAVVRDDPDLARGPLDLKRLVATKHDATAPLELTLITYGTWPARLLHVSGGNRLGFLFNPDRDGRAEFAGEVVYRYGRLVLRITNRDGDVVRRLRVIHPRPDRIEVTIPRGLPNPDGNTWLAATMRYQTATGYCADGCHDRLPSGAGWVTVTPGA